MSFKLRWLALLVLTGTIPVLVAAVVMGQFYIHEKKTALDRSMGDSARALSLAISRELESQKALLSIISDTPRLDPPIRRGSFEELARRFRARLPLWEVIHVANPEGNILLSEPTPDTYSPARTVRDRASFDSALKTGKPVVGSVFKTSRELATFPIRTVVNRKKVQFVLSALVRTDAIGNVLFQNEFPSSWLAWITDARGNLVAATQASPAIIGESSKGFVTKDASVAGVPAKGTLSTGEDVRIISAPVAGTEWLVNVSVPLEVYQQVGRDGYRLLLAAVVLILALCVLAGILLQRELAARRRQEASIATMQRMDALGKLTGGVAHDFNNLLMVFQSGMAGLQRRRHDDAKFAMTLDMMADGISRGKAITERLLSFSRRSSQNVETIFIQDQAEELEQLVRQAVTDRVVVEFDLDPDLWPVTVDRQGLEVALVNLATNAREAMPNGGRLIVRGRNTERADKGMREGAVTLSIIDNGEGIAAAHVDRVFEPFFTTKGGRSHGLGLSQVYGFAQRNGGSVRADSVEGQGASFTLYLPRAVGSAASHSSRSGDEATLPRRILVVDDTPASLDACRLALEVEGVQVLTATGGEEALALIARDPSIAFVVSDVMMPGMSGLELSEKLRNDHPATAVVLMTGYSDVLEAGFRTDRPVIAKPFAVQELAPAFAKAAETVKADQKIIPLRPSS
jgi:signal transduction histidine kinase/CheY-like chemotaxis protein